MARGEEVGLNRVAWLMSENGIQVCRPKRFRTSAAFMPGLGWLPLVAGVVALGLLSTGLLLCWRRFNLSEKRRVKWLGLATIMALGPSLASLPQGRSVILSSLAIASLACLVLTGYARFSVTVDIP